MGKAEVRKAVAAATAVQDVFGIGTLTAAFPANCHPACHRTPAPNRFYSRQHYWVTQVSHSPNLDVARVACGVRSEALECVQLAAAFAPASLLAGRGCARAAVAVALSFSSARADLKVGATSTNFNGTLP